VAAVSPEDLFRHINFDDIFGGLGFEVDFGGGGLFERFFRRQRRPAGPPHGANLEVDLQVSLERVASGGQETVQVWRPTTCQACGGSGAKAGTTPRRCDACSGSGRQVTSRQESGITMQQITTCPGCHGRGSIIDELCPECHGRGEVEREETLTVTIPVGVEEGMALRIPGHGLPGPVSGAPPGDLFVVVQSQADARFERRGADLWRQETVHVVDATLGTEVEVPTLDGSTTVTIPPGTQPDTLLRLRGKGLPEFGGGSRGDLYLRLGVHVSERLSSAERKLYERLRALRGRESET
jgi:molecular chaperone DnaJ